MAVCGKLAHSINFRFVGTGVLQQLLALPSVYGLYLRLSTIHTQGEGASRVSPRQLLIASEVRAPDRRWRRERVGYG